MTEPNRNRPKRVEHSGHLKWVFVHEIHVDPDSQRDLRVAWATAIANGFDPDPFGIPVLSFRDNKYFVIDGQHRIEALRIMGWDDQQVQCLVYDALTQPEEARMFLELNNQRVVNALDKFLVGVAAELPDELDIQRIVLLAGLKVAKGKQDGAMTCVSALRIVYHHGAPVLVRTLLLASKSYGDPGLRSAVIRGIGLFCARYDGQVDDPTIIERLQSERGGLGGLLARAEMLRRTLGQPIDRCVAAAMVDIVNKGMGRKKLATWWT